MMVVLDKPLATYKVSIKSIVRNIVGGVCCLRIPILVSEQKPAKLRSSPTQTITLHSLSRLGVLKLVLSPLLKPDYHCVDHDKGISRFISLSR